MDLKLDFVFFHQKKQNEKISHENEAKNRRPKRAPIVRGAKRGAHYAEFGTEFGIISAPGRLENKRIRNPTKMKWKFGDENEAKMKQKFGAPSGRQFLDDH